MVDSKKNHLKQIQEYGSKNWILHMLNVTLGLYVWIPLPPGCDLVKKYDGNPDILILGDIFCGSVDNLNNKHHQLIHLPRLFQWFKFFPPQSAGIAPDID